MIFSRFLLTILFTGLLTSTVCAGGTYYIDKDNYGLYISADTIIQQTTMQDKASPKAPGIRREPGESRSVSKQSFQRNIEKIEIGDKKRDVIHKMGYPDLTETVNQPQIDVFTRGGVIVSITPTMEEWTYFGPEITAIVIFQNGEVIQKP